MRKLLAITLFATACTNVPSNENDYDSVRQRLTDEPTSLYVRSGSSFGTITARRRLADGWSTAETPLEIELEPLDRELTVRIDRRAHIATLDDERRLGRRPTVGNATTCGDRAEARSATDVERRRLVGEALANRVVLVVVRRHVRTRGRK
jgi:hypothetical protein